ncbi:MAG: porin family protein [Prevotellaceae bacterium]|nr:porin family protein [Prevotellaceae bacterium]
MKKNILTLVALVAALTIAMPSQAQVKFGIKAGLNVNTPSLKDAVKFKDSNRAGFFAGPTADVTIPLAGLGADISLLYDYKSLSLTGENDQTNKVEKGTKSLHYITLPINVKYTFGLSSLASVYVATGPQFSWNLGNRSWKIGNLTDDWELKKSEFSWNVGAGATFISHVRIGYNYNIGIGETAEASFINTAGKAIKGKLKNNTHQISLTYFF